MLVVSSTCLTVIDHIFPGKNRIFITCDMSDWCIGACLSFSDTWEMARLVAYDSMQLNSTEQNYPIHKKELLAIIHALKKWCSDLLGTDLLAYTDHWTLKHFDTQWDLSRWQLQWQEYMSQYEMTITYIHGEDNSVADALMSLLIRYTHIPFYFHFSFTFSPPPIHHCAPLLWCDHTCLIGPISLIWWTHDLWFTCIYFYS